MRRLFFASSLLVLAIIGYAVSGISAQSAERWPVGPGDRVRLWYPGESGVACTITSIQNDFVSCAAQQPVDRFPMVVQTRNEWFNLRTLKSIERLPNER